jgi:hypothetical protein
MSAIRRPPQMALLKIGVNRSGYNGGSVGIMKEY